MGDMIIRTTDTDKLLVTGWTSTIHFENITRDRVLTELNQLKSSFSNLTSLFGELTDIIRENRLTVEFHMKFDDSGKAGVGICSEIDGTLNWYI